MKVLNQNISIENNWYNNTTQGMQRSFKMASRSSLFQRSKISSMHQKKSEMLEESIPSEISIDSDKVEDTTPTKKPNNNNMMKKTVNGSINNPV